jgi:hypothetical protein
MCISLPPIQMRSIDFIAALTIDIQGLSSEGKGGCWDWEEGGGRKEGGREEGGGDMVSFIHRVHILVEMKQGQCICPLSSSVHRNFTGEGKCNERGWACTPHPHQPGLILPSSLNVRQNAAVSTLCTLWFHIFLVVKHVKNS